MTGVRGEKSPTLVINKGYKMLKPAKEIISDKDADKFLNTIAKIKKQRKEKKEKDKRTHSSDG